MSLYVRLQTSFFTHRKTLRLRALIGEAAFWVPPRLWAYAADNQPDGDFSNFTPDELSYLIGYQGDGAKMLEALQQASFMDGMKLHDWEDYNGCHAYYAERAKKAAAARWKGHKKRVHKKRRDDMSQALLEQSPSIASSNATSIRHPTDAEWLVNLKNDKTYAGIDVEREYGKMVNWCKTNRQIPSRRRFINWINRAEKPMIARQESTNVDFRRKLEDLKARRKQLTYTEVQHNDQKRAEYSALTKQIEELERQI